MKLTHTQQSILAVLSDTEFESPLNIGERAGIDNSGGTAASLRVLLRNGLVEQKSLGFFGRWELFGYRRAESEDHQPNITHGDSIQVIDQTSKFAGRIGKVKTLWWTNARPKPRWLVMVQFWRGTFPIQPRNFAARDLEKLVD